MVIVKSNKLCSNTTLKEITIQTDEYLVSLSSKTYVFKDHMAMYQNDEYLVSLSSKTYVFEGKMTRYWSV